MDIPYASPILNQGVLGALCLIFMVVIWVIFKLLVGQFEARRQDVERMSKERLDDAKKLQDGLLEPIDQIKKNSALELTFIQQILDKLK